MNSGKVPLVSVIVPCFNQARFLPDAVESILAQTHVDWECLIIDDGSTDGTAAIGRAVAQNDGRIRLLTQSNRGLAGARNRGLAEARGKFIQFLDADDAIKPDKLKRQLQALTSGDTLALAYCDYYIAAEDDLDLEIPEYHRSPKLRTERCLEELAQRWEVDLSIPCQCFLFDARFFSEQGVRFDERLPNHEDWECWMQIFALNPLICYVDAKLAVYRFHWASLSRNRRKMRRGFLQAVAAQRARFVGNKEMLAVLTRKRSEILIAYRDQTLPQTWRRAMLKSSLPVRAFLGRVIRAVLPEKVITRLKKRLRLHTKKAQG